MTNPSDENRGQGHGGEPANADEPRQDWTPFRIPLANTGGVISSARQRGDDGTGEPALDLAELIRRMTEDGTLQALLARRFPIGLAIAGPIRTEDAMAPDLNTGNDAMAAFVEAAQGDEPVTPGQDASSVIGFGSVPVGDGTDTHVTLVRMSLRLPGDGGVRTVSIEQIAEEVRTAIEASDDFDAALDAVLGRLGLPSEHEHYGAWREAIKRSLNVQFGLGDTDA